MFRPVAIQGPGYNLYIRFLLIFSSVLLIQNHTEAQPTSSHTVTPAQQKESGTSFSDSSSYTLQYKKTGSAELYLTIFPSVRRQTKAPAIVFFFGGGWQRGSIGQFKPHAQYFAQRGLSGILVDYRVSSRHNTTPFDAVEDARSALHFITQHADEIGIDKNRIILSGGSAGGHLALISSFLPKYKNVENQKTAALVLFNPVIDTGPEGYGYERLGEDYETISPVDNIPENPPPMIIFLGTQDNIIDVTDAENFCRLVHRNRGYCQLELYKGQKHGFFNYKNTEHFIRTVRKADQFLVRQQFIEGESNVKAWMKKHN